MSINKYKESDMDQNLQNVCQAILQPEGDDLLRLMRAVYLHQAEKIPLILSPQKQLLDKARELGLLVAKVHQVDMTPMGYMIGSIAKEYCNWVDNQRRMPAPRPPESFIADKDVLDLGCSFGRWIWEFQPSARSVLGIELQPEYVELGKVLARKENKSVPNIIQDSAENLHAHVSPQSLDFIFARLVFNHIAIRSTLNQISEALRPGGIAWLQVETFSQTLKLFLRREKRLRSKVFQFFAVLNSLLCMVCGLQLSLRTKGRMHSVHKPAFPSLRWWKKTCASAGLTDFHLEYHEGGTAAFWVRKS